MHRTRTTTDRAPHRKRAYGPARPSAARHTRRRARRLMDRIGLVPLRRTIPRAAWTSKASRVIPPLGAIVYHRAAFGPAPGDIDAFEALGSTDAARIEAWVDRQLDPDSIPDTELEARIAASNFTTLNKTLQQQWTDHWLPDDIDWNERFRPMLETQAAVFLRTVYSRRQLFEVMVGFWHDHFNIYGWHDEAGPVFGHWDREVIRANALGNFRTMLEDVTAATAMLFYLDNVYNEKDGPNENYAREVMELHTMGEENYMGAIPAASVPLGPGGAPVAYVDEDVREMARCLTGWSVNEDTGEFLYRDGWHDTGAKHVLGLDIPANLAPLEDVRRVLDRLATHPGTARHIATKLCRRLLADDPPESLVESVAGIFLENASAPDQIARVVRAILVSPEFAATWGEKVKRPFELVISAMRTMNPDFTMDLAEDMTWWLLWLVSETGHAPFEWRPPTGYPDTRETWLGANPLVGNWRMINWLTDMRYPSGTGPYRFDVYAATPGNLRTSEELADYWIERCLGRPMDPADRRIVVEFMAQGHLPDLDIGIATDEEVQNRLRTMVGLILTSPDAILR